MMLPSFDDSTLRAVVNLSLALIFGAVLLIGALFLQDRRLTRIRSAVDCSLKYVRLKYVLSLIFVVIGFGGLRRCRLQEFVPVFDKYGNLIAYARCVDVRFYSTVTIIFGAVLLICATLKVWPFRRND